MCDRADLAAEEKIRFTSSILPKWARRTKSLDAMLPILYLRGVDRRLPGGARRVAGQGRSEPITGVEGGIAVIQTTPMRLDSEIRSTVAGHRLQLRICLIGAPADLSSDGTMSGGSSWGDRRQSMTVA